jgi:hypothetical protein
MILRKIRFNVYEYCNEGIDPQIDNLQNVPLDIISEWVEINKKESIYYPNIQELPENELKYLLGTKNQKSSLRFLP